MKVSVSIQSNSEHKQHGMKPGKGGEKEKEQEQESLNEDVTENPELYKSPLLPTWIRMICTRREIMASFSR